MLTELSQENFKYYWESLIRYSRKFNLSTEDIEEIVSDSIRQAHEKLDRDRGEFESFCRVILKNKIFNFKRDNKDLFVLVVFDEYEDLIQSENLTYEEKERNAIAKKFLNELKENLNSEELQFFNETYNICDSSERINISKASKNLGIDPNKGWDIFRRIQRKAMRMKRSLWSQEERRIEDSILSEKEPVNYSISLHKYNEEAFEKNSEKSEMNESGFYKFLASLSEYELTKLNYLYNK